MKDILERFSVRRRVVPGAAPDGTPVWWGGARAPDAATARTTPIPVTTTRATPTGTAPTRIAAADTGAAAPPPCPAPSDSDACAGDGEAVALPSGSHARLVEVVRDTPGPAGPTWRYRFIMPDLANQMPEPDLPATEELTPEDMAELDNLGLGDATQAPDDSGLVSPEDLDLPDFAPGDFDAQDDGDRQIEEGAEQPLAVPPDPDVLLLDPVHKDILWLCEHWILPQIDAAADLPAQIIISLSDRPVEFGTIDTRAVQLFEAFSIAPDRKSCIWEPW